MLFIKIFVLTLSAMATKSEENREKKSAQIINKLVLKTNMEARLKPTLVSDKSSQASKLVLSKEQIRIQLTDLKKKKKKKVLQLSKTYPTKAKTLFK